VPSDRCDERVLRALLAVDPDDEPAEDDQKEEEADDR
jgi:hypothetical protein